MKGAQSLKSRTKRGGGGICIYLIHVLVPEQKSKPFYDNCHKRTLDGLTDPQNPLSLHLNKDGASVKFNDDDDDDASHD